MSEIGALDIRTVSAFHPDAERMRHKLSEVLEVIVGDPGRNSFSNWQDDDAGHVFVVAYADGAPIGCGGLRVLEPGIGEIKRMYADAHNGGAGSALLAHLENVARQWGLDRIRMETRKSNLGAIRFYQRRGYVIIAAYGRYVGRADAVCFEKLL